MSIPIISGAKPYRISITTCKCGAWVILVDWNFAFTIKSLGIGARQRQSPHIEEQEGHQGEYGGASHSDGGPVTSDQRGSQDSFLFQ